MVKQKVRADMILREISKRHIRDLFITEVKDGPTMWGEHRRIDAVAIKCSWRHPCITGYEVKVNRKDFERDEKWPGYRDMCHRLYFACPAGLIQPEELPGDVGLIWFNQEKRTIFTKRAAAFRDIEIPGQMLYYLLIARTDTDRHPFFSNRREFLEAWLEDKAERRELGDRVGTKLAQEVHEKERLLRAARARIQEMERGLGELGMVKEIMRRHGAIISHDWLRDLEKMLTHKIPPRIAEGLKAIDREVQRLLGAIGEEQHDGTQGELLQVLHQSGSFRRV